MRTPTRAQVGDVALALVFALVGVVGTHATNMGPETEQPGQTVDALGYALVVTNALILVVRRRWPLVVLSTSAVLTSTFLILSYAYGPILFAFAVAVYTAARHHALTRSVPVAVGSGVVLLTHVVLDSPGLLGLWGVVPASAWVLVPFSLGFVIRLNREAAARERNEVIRQHVDEERLRMAQDVHDIVGHGLTAIKMQADVSLHVLARKPEQARTALEAISDTSGQALKELRATLDVARRRAATDEERAPTPSLARLDGLRERLREAGLPIEIEVTGEPYPLPTVADVTGYRVVQEALTNVLRHSDADVATVCVDYQTDTVRITVSNPTTQASADSGGLGLSGLRERVTALGGTFTAGASDDHFDVQATIPAGGHR